MDLNNGILNHYAIGITQRALDDTACKVLPIGSVLVAMYGGAGTIGKNGLLHIQATTNQALCALLPCPQFLPQFVLYFMQFQRPYWMVGADGTRKDPNISQDRIRESVMVLPPLPEQLRIVEYIGRETSSLQIACSRLEREIELLREYRTRLVADVVTGKLDVREAASRLPEDIEPATADDETDPEIDPEETEAEAVA
jgi:type I restriction enzyme S subunit